METKIIPITHIISNNTIRPLSIFEIVPDPIFPYQTVQIGNQIWMAENLHEDDGGEGITKVDSVISNGYELGPQTYYTYDAAVRVANTVDGWHLPSRDEWNTLITLMNSNSTDVKSTYGWNNDGNGTNLTGLNILPVGRINYYSTTVSNIGGEANIWSSTNISDTNAYATFVYNNTTSWNDNLTSRNKQYKNSVRLIKDT